ncbi:cysteine desulfurase NifS [candidate division WOR-1 bacterium RIFOXYA12_FULL_52_29]|uniref:Cysteine desulfurase IscS n=1 Tax=candidate division WOR-1 bacterium RIFOXYC12_FULL_54_18 TaxID=1802584 RepID=A0A1F4T5P1_UNCSA|nr:MAG: cysteine desulfurase NifS [candidate division WOR-1 bacterium RIFOXYA2_FULL_51_19]OGC17714.1 MAG: cysteine desulfurase NifS [candidate division WOR-1 bacterium RIFOXYA12_FULL_52_29]OGC26571.1 MAG: cysteine desulfurase NifS [candidate division WOR-1 bacterium RIFOXYB2_FULL_45_9]OGC28131.1 MAG: cysteine desulfurase NifS [candidate division WOR-1 bacterium RIFOXYC12_FULL_54_18]OGC29583.1 MAG: cysteine desulfurase NifS [candidate division WOR-1 bacterium RIFOXYB12_FULL_52_16]
MNRIYLDYAATTPCDKRVALAMAPYFTDKFGNPSSIHGFGQETRGAVEKAREQVARLINAKPKEIVFTSGGTEADNHALLGVAYANEKKGDHLVVSAVEHHAVLECAEFLKKRGLRVTTVPVDKYGLVDPVDVAKAIEEKTILVSVMQANNEIGTIQPIAEIAKAVKAKGAYFHTDAVQTAGHLPIDVEKLGIDLLSASAHKLYGPKGVGCLYIRKGTRLTSFLHGGAQEGGKRGSTENVPGIVGFGAAAELAGGEMETENQRVARLRDKLKEGLLAKIPESQLNGHPTDRLPNNLNITIKYVEGESMLLSLDMEGIAASTGSACSSGSLEPSHVLLAIGLPHELAHGSVRFSLGKYTTEAEIDRVLAVFPPIVERLRQMSPLYNCKE